MGTSVDLKAYWEQVSRFSQYPEDKRAGLRTGFIGELGELYNAYTKHLRGRYDVLEFKEKLIDELGDLLWFAVMWAEYHNAPMGNNEQVGRLFSPSLDTFPEHALQWLLLAAEELYEMISVPEVVEEWLMDVLECALAVTEYADTTLQVVLENNVAKLTERYGQ